MKSRSWSMIRAIVLIPALGAFVPAGSGTHQAVAPAPGACEASAPARIDSAYARWNRLLGRRSTLAEGEFLRRADAVVREAFAPEAMGERILEGRWEKLNPLLRERFVAALVRSLRFRLLADLGDERHPPRLVVSDGEARVDGSVLDIPYRLIRSEGEEALRVRVVEDPAGSCRIVDLRGGDRELLEDVRDRVKHLMNEYSFADMVAELGDYDFISLEDFETTPEGELPVGWTWKGKDNDKNKPYRVKLEGGNKYLEATDEGESVILGHRIRWNLDKYPYVSFRVRVWKIPQGGDERFDDKVDSAAGIYFTLKKKFFGKIPESVKYVWSSTLPVGAAVRRKGIGKPWQVAFGSGTAGLGEWHTYVFDLRQAYKDTFGGDVPSRPEGIGVLSDANSLKSQAYADYDDIRALRTAPPGVTSGVREILAPGGHSQS